MIWPHDRSGLSLISSNLSSEKAGRGDGGFMGAALSQSDLWSGAVDARPERPPEVSGGADPRGGLGGESHCQPELMGSKIPQLTKTCERLGDDTFVIQIGSQWLCCEVCCWRTFSEERNTNSWTDKQTRFPFFPPNCCKFSYFYITKL